MDAGHRDIGRDTCPPPHDDEQRRRHVETLVDAIDLPIGRRDRDGRLPFCNAPYEGWALRPRAALS